jgi:hypothetical protein
MWKIDLKDKWICKSRYDHIYIYIYIYIIYLSVYLYLEREKMIVIVGLLEGLRGRRERKRE